MYKLVILKTAESELLQIFNYIANDNLEQARKFTDSMLLTIDTLKHFPNIGKPAHDENDRILGNRYLIYGNYKVYYFVYSKTNTIAVARIIHSAKSTIS